MAESFELNLNGRPVRVEGLSPNTTLLDYLRGIGLTGAKEGCAEGDCGACTVAVLDRNARGAATWRAINSCLVPLPALAGREVLTVEGVAAAGQFHPVQRALVDCHGSQCGYCTPGFVMSLFEGFYRDDLGEPSQLDDQLCGNLCRCTGYRPIRDAAREAFRQRHRRDGADNFAQRLRSTSPALPPIAYERHAERFFRPVSLSNLFELMAAHPPARLVAGATELGLEITKRFERFPALISLEAIPDLTELEPTESEWRIGAAAPLTRLEETVAAEYPALEEMLRLFGSRQVRNRATLGGNLVTASPIGDAAPVLLALDARVVLASGQRERTLPLADFFIGYRQTALQPGEILKTIVLPRVVAQPGWRGLSRFLKVSKRREMDISTIAAGFAIALDKEGRVQHARLAYGGVALTPARARRTEQALLGRPWTAESIAEVLPVARAEFDPISDVRGSAEYRRQLVGSLLDKFFEETSPDRGVGGSAPLNPGRAGFHPGPLIPEMMGAGGTAPSLAPAPHESAHLHVTGQAMYTDDLAAHHGLLEVWPVCAPHAHARIVRRDAAAAGALPGVCAVLLAEDVPGVNDIGGVKRDEILLADKEALFHGHLVALVVGDSFAVCRRAAAQVMVEYEPLPALLSIEAALQANSFHAPASLIRRGNLDRALAESPLTLEGEFFVSGQEHFYLEMQAAWAERSEDGTMFVMSSTQHPSEVQDVVARVLGLSANQIVVQVPRLGGGFGGKETQAAAPAALAALAAWKTGRRVRVRWNRDQDMMLTGKRHSFLARFKVGFHPNGALRAVKVELFSNGGWSLDLSQAVTERALFHLDNAYYIPALEFSGRVLRTNLASNTAFRGFGGPQGMLVMEEILDRVARRLGLSPEEVRERNLYRGGGETNTTPYGQELPDNRLQTIWHQLKASSGLAERRRAVGDWNRAHTHRKRGLAMTPVKFGISFTQTHLNQAGALVLLYEDGSVQVNHGGIEMGQGLHTNIRAIAARELGVTPDRVRVMPTSTDKVPNTSATAASCGTDLNGAAVHNACQTLRTRLLPVAADLLGLKRGCQVPPLKILFQENRVLLSEAPQCHASLAEVAHRARGQRISLAATGFYATPDLHYDRAEGRGKPFHYFACGAAVAEVEVDGFTGMMRVLRVDILHDVGDSINAGVNRGQVEGGFVQGLGWLTSEELVWDDQGRLLTHSPDTYKIPAVGDVPGEFHVSFLTGATPSNTIYGSKAVGEPPLMLAISAREAIREAVAAFGSPGGEVPLAVPATSEAIFRAIQGRLGEGPR